MSVRSYALQAAGGTRVPIAAEGIVIGRSARCDLVIDGAGISRIQAIVHLDPEGPIIVVTGRAATTVNGRAVESGQRLGVGDELAIEDHRYHVVSDVDTSSAPGGGWMIRDGAGQLYGVTRGPLEIGGSAAKLRVDGWPDRVAVLHPAERLVVEAVEAVSLDGVEVAPGEVVPADVGAVLAYRGVTFQVVVGGAAHGAATAGKRGAPTRVVLELMPRGGRLVMAWGDRKQAVYLPERRCELVALLLKPPSPYRAGELVPDEVVLARLGTQRVQLNVIIHRARADLVRAGLDGTALIERATGGNATRFVIDANASVMVL